MVKLFSVRFYLVLFGTTFGLAVQLHVKIKLEQNQMQTYVGLICSLFVMAPYGLCSVLHYVDELEPVKKKSCFTGSKQILRVKGKMVPH